MRIVIILGTGFDQGTRVSGTHLVWDMIGTSGNLGKGEDLKEKCIEFFYIDNEKINKNFSNKPEESEGGAYF